MRLGRPHLVRLKALLTVLIPLILLLLVAACGDDADDDDGAASTSTASTATTTTTTVSTSETSPTTEGSTTTDTAEAAQFVDIYFVQGNGYATPVAVAVPAGPGVAGSAIRALIAGPTPAQQADGLSSAVPRDTELLGLTVEDGLARIDLSREFEAGGGTFSMTARLGQVVYTLTEFATIDEVEFWLDGQPVTVFSSEGLLLEEPVTRADYLASLPLSPTVLDGVELWQQADLPDLSDVAETRRVVLVAADDVLNVRLGAGVGNEVMGMLAPGVEVALTGPRTEVGTSTWVEIVTPAGAGWVNGHFLAEIVDDQVFAEDERVTSLLDELTTVITARGDLADVASARGLYVSHHAAPVRFDPDELARVLTDPIRYKWPSNALDIDDPDQAEEIPGRTFAEAIGDSFASTWDDPDRMFARDEPLAGGNGRLPSDAIPPSLSGFHFISVHDPGDNPDYGGIDWTSWHVSIDYEDGRPVIVGLTLDQWAP